MAYFEKAIKIILKYEGGYVWNPDDPGGETKYGISKRQYPNLDIKNLTKKQAKEIYRKDYWNKINGGDINDDDIALQIFDFAVNSGVKRAVKVIQKICWVKEDGVLGNNTLHNINQADALSILYLYKLRRIEYYVKLARKKSLRQFLYSWIKRTL